MLCFGLMTIVNIRGTKRRVQIINSNTSSESTINSPQQLKKVDHYLLLMLFVQVILFAIFTLPQNIQKFIGLATASETKSALETAKENFMFNFFLLFAYLANGMTFYIYTLFGGSIFRNELIKLTRGNCQRIVNLFKN
ncbi:hypothetical protein I4U23_001307 [Adineta vaga]|nr:hypothetical protein I4U23_001307 [Adineta vaga]